MSKLVTVIDLGSNKITAASARIRRDGRFSVLALEHLNSRGVTRGQISDMEKAVLDISEITKRIEKVSKKRIKELYVTAKNPDIEMLLSKGTIALSKTPREITKKDTDECIKIASLTKIPLKQRVIHKVTRGFSIDDTSLIVANPIGLYGLKLEAEVYVATSPESLMDSITKCIDHAGFILKGIYLSSLTTAECVLEESEKEKGVLLLDIGESASEALVFKDKSLYSFQHLRLGGDTILESGMRPNKEKLRKLCNEVKAILGEAEKYVESAVVTGGGALIDGMLECAENTFKCPTRMGLARKAGRHLDTQEALIHTSTIGLIEFIAKEYAKSHHHGNPLNKLVRKVLYLYESYF